MNAPQVHLMLNHVPVLGAIFVTAALAAGLWWRREPLVRFALAALVAIAIAGVPVYVSGGRSEDTIERMPGVSESTIERHEDMSRLAAIALGALGVLALAAMTWFRQRDVPRALAMLLLAGIVLTSGMLAWTAHLGGQIRHDELRAGPAAATTDSEATPRSHEDE